MLALLKRKHIIWRHWEDEMNRTPLARRTQIINAQWTFVALDPESKLVPCYRVGKRTRPNAVAFMADLSERLNGRIQLSSDALSTYGDAVERAFGSDVDCGKRLNFTTRSQSVLAATRRLTSRRRSGRLSSATLTKPISRPRW
jgi:hypothetical protein